MRSDRAAAGNPGNGWRVGGPRLASSARMAVSADAQLRDREVDREVHREGPIRGDASPDAPALVVKDATGTRWRVTEVRGTDVPGARGSSCLVFESDAAIRRVWDYPPSWRQLPGPELIRQVSWGR